MEADGQDDTSTALAALRLRIIRLEDERAILDTLHRYGQTIDSGLDQEWAELFIKDGLFLCVDRFGTEILREQGRKALAQWVRDFKAGETLQMKHCVLAPVVRINGDMATVVSQYANLVENQDRHAAPHIRFTGTYRDEMVKDNEGSWRFRQRISHTDAPLVDLRAA
jgi:uncharacterized protein YxjI